MAAKAEKINHPTSHSYENPAIGLLVTRGISLTQHPTLTIEQYAMRTGLEIGVVRGHCDKGYLPTVKHGKYKMINMVALSLELAEAYTSTIH